MVAANRRASVDVAGVGTYLMALQGDWSGIAERLRNNLQLNPDERELVADYLEGKIKRPSHRTRSFATAQKYRSICRRVRTLTRQGWKKLAAVKQASQDFQVSETTVHNALREVSN